ncbi:MAG: hypothetical protein P1V51_09955 [Deltaproteobacteria bacterium]|nr:hypothetical protein [Deltaproteobacteria bacterium]
MRRLQTLALIPVMAFGLLLTACPGEPGDPDGGTPDGSTVCNLGEENCCTRNRDCSHLTTSTYTAVCGENDACEFLCNVASDCAGADFEPVACAAGDCVCDLGTCTLPSCSNDADCGGTGLCVGGSCEAGEAAPDGCVLAPNPIFTQTGATVQLYGYATKGGEFVVSDGTWSYASGDTAIADVSAAGVVTGGASAGTAQITATITGSGGTGTCTVAVNNYVTAGADEVQVAVFDELSRTPVEGAVVVVEDASNGTEVGQGATATDGSVTLSGITAASINVHVFTEVDATSAMAPNGYAYISAMSISDKDVAVYLPRNANGSKAGGYQGEMTVQDFMAISGDDVHVMLAGVSLPGNFIDLDLEVLIGEMIPTHVVFGSLLDDTLPLPSGLVLGVGSEFFKADYKPLGHPGTRTAWALGGNLPIQDVTNVLGPVVGGGTSDLPIGQLLGALLPLFNGFNSAVEPGVAISEYDRVAGTDPDGNPIMVPDFGQFPQQDVNLDTKLALKGEVSIPNLPQLPDGTYLDGTVILAGVLVDGQGLVPLGITAGLDVADATTQTPNGIVNDEGDDATPGKAIIRMAPQHGGIEGSRYVLVALSLGFDSMGTTGGGTQALSGAVHFFDGLSWEENISLGSSFLTFADSATYDAGTRAYTPASVTGADFYRLAVDGTDDRTWIIYHDGTTAMTLVDPAGYTCGAGACEDRAIAGANLDAQAVGSGGVSASDLFGWNGTNLDGLVETVQSFSTIDVTVP